MLPFIVIILGVVFLILWYSGILNEIAAGGRSRPTGRRDLPDRELERRLQVFERFLSRGDSSTTQKDEEERS